MADRVHYDKIGDKKLSYKPLELIMKICTCGKEFNTEFDYCSRKCFFAASKASSEAKAKGHKALWEMAHEAGMKAAKALVPVPMVVQEHENPFDDKSKVVYQEVVRDGVCGFAWIIIRPGNSSFALWAKKNIGAQKAYNGGMEIWVSDFGQSMEKKYAYANAVAKVLVDSGIRAYAGSRMD